MRIPSRENGETRCDGIESEIISLDAGLRLDGSPALDLWVLIVAVLGNSNQNRTEQGDLLKNKREVRSTPYTIQKRKQS